MEKKLQYTTLDFNFSGKKWNDPKENWPSMVRVILTGITDLDLFLIMFVDFHVHLKLMHSTLTT